MQHRQPQQVSHLTLDVHHLQQQHLAQHLELDAFHKAVVDHMEFQLDVFRVQMEFASGPQQQ